MRHSWAHLEVVVEQVFAILETSLEDASSGIVIADAPDVTIRWANRAALELRGTADQPLTGIDVSRHSVNWQLIRPDGSPYPPEDLPLSRAILKGESRQNQEFIIRHTQGDDHWVLGNAAPIPASLSKC